MLFSNTESFIWQDFYKLYWNIDLAAVYVIQFCLQIQLVTDSLISH